MNSEKGVEGTALVLRLSDNITRVSVEANQAARDRLGAAMTRAKSRKVAPREKSERIKRSRETEGSPASI